MKHLALILSVIALLLSGFAVFKVAGRMGAFNLAPTSLTGLWIQDTSNSTLQVGKASSAGCLILGDSSAGASPVYITATGSTITGSTTKPSACQTAN